MVDPRRATEADRLQKPALPTDNAYVEVFRPWIEAANTLGHVDGKRFRPLSGEAVVHRDLDL